MTCYKLGEVLHMISGALVGVFDVQALQNAVVDLCMTIFEAEACSLFLADERSGNLTMKAARGYSANFLGRTARIVPREQVVERPTTRADQLGITGWIASTGQSFTSNTPDEHRSHLHWTGQYDIQQFGPDKSVHNFYGVPLRVAEDRILGVLKVEGKRERGVYCPWTPDDTNICDILAAHVAIAISNAGRFEAIQSQREQLKTITDALHKVVASLSEELPMTYLLDEIVATTAEVLSAEACVLFMLDPTDPNRLIETAGQGYAAQLIGKAEYRLIPKADLKPAPEPDERVGLTAWIAITGEHFLARNNQDLRDHPHWRGGYDKQHYGESGDKKCESFLGVPLRVGDRVVGVLKVENKRVAGEYVPFTEQDVQVFETLAKSVAIAIGTVQEQRVKREQEVTDAMYRVSAALAGRFELEPLLNEIVEVGMRILSAEACVVYLIDPSDPRRLTETAGKGYAAHLIGKAEYRLIPKEELKPQPQPEERVGLTAWIAITGEAFLARNNEELSRHPHWRGKYDPNHYPPGSGKKCYSFLGLPLRVGQDVLGVLKVENKNIGGNYVPFDEREQHIFQVLANSAAIAIHNARELQKYQAARQLAAIGQSAGEMAHRMGTPLQNILLAAEMLDKHLKASPAPSNIEARAIPIIVTQVEHMAHAIERVRKASKQPKPVIRTHNIDDLLRRSFTENPSFAAQFERRHIQARITGLEWLGEQQICCDAELVDEALGNLVSNALEAVADGGRIELRIGRQEGRFCIEVEDDGPGLDETEITPFAPFGTTKKGGLGIGLFIVQRNIEAHKGTVNHVRTMRGCCFRIELPAQP